jgi:hypothetical protein
MQDFYEVLGISHRATSAEIRSAYRKLARKHHPDISASSDANAQFARINEAYHVLIDPRRRAAYDRGDYVDSVRTFYARAAEVAAIQKEFDKMFDEILAHERQESAHRFEAVLLVVPLFLSSFYVMAAKPTFIDLHWAAQAAVVTLALYGLFYLVRNLSRVLARYTYEVPDHMTSVFQPEAPPDKPISRTAGLVFLVCGFIVSIGFGHLVSRVFPALSGRISLGVILSVLLFPPIAVLLVGGLRRALLFLERF